MAEVPNERVCARRSHTKTRTGCADCKRRKIKCDESKPECWNCVRHSITCSYRRSSSRSLASLYSLTPGTANSPPNDDGLQPLNTIQLELAFHYSTCTAMTLTQNPILQTVFQTRVPEVGLQYPFVMRGILGLSALHKARFLPQQKRAVYLDLARREQEASLRATTALLPDINAESCSALYISASIITYFALAAPNVDAGSQETTLVFTKDGHVAPWLELIRGIRHICDPWLDVVLAGPVGSIFRIGKLRWQEGLSVLADLSQVKDIVPLADLKINIRVAASCSPAEIGVYDEAIIELARAFYRSSSYSAEYQDPGASLSFLYIMSQDYLNFLEQGKPEALAIFSFFCVLLHQMNGYWWMSGWGMKLLKWIYQELDQHYRLWIRWPMNAMGFVPS